MGVVYKAEDPRLKRQVALKFLTDERPVDARTLDRFRWEAQALSALNHPNICVIYDIGEEGGRPFIVMELLEGRSLRDIVAEGPMPADAAIDVGIQIADALERGARARHHPSRPEAREHLPHDSPAGQAARFRSRQGRRRGRARTGRCWRRPAVSRPTPIPALRWARPGTWRPNRSVVSAWTRARTSSRSAPSSTSSSPAAPPSPDGHSASSRTQC